MFPPHHLTQGNSNLHAMSTWFSNPTIKYWRPFDCQHHLATQKLRTGIGHIMPSLGRLGWSTLLGRIACLPTQVGSVSCPLWSGWGRGHSSLLCRVCHTLLPIEVLVMDSLPIPPRATGRDTSHPLWSGWDGLLETADRRLQIGGCPPKKKKHLMFQFNGGGMSFLPTHRILPVSVYFQSRWKPAVHPSKYNCIK